MREAPLPPHWPAIAKEISQGLAAILVNNTPALEALARAQERAQAIVNGQCACVGGAGAVARGTSLTKEEGDNGWGSYRSPAG